MIGRQILPPRSFASHMKKTIAALFLGLCMLPFVPGLYGPFQLDDLSNLEAARAATGTFNEIWHAISQNGTGLLHRPIANLSFYLNYRYFGVAALSYKVVNLILHWLVTLVFWRVAVHLLALLYPDYLSRRRDFAALFIAALWALHPIQVSAVLYVVQRMAELSALFVGLGLLAFLRFIEKPTTATGNPLAILQAAAVWLVVGLGLFSKENAILFPVFVMVIYLVAADPSQHFIRRDQRTRALFAYCGWLPLLVGGLSCLVAVPWLVKDYASREFTLGERLLTEPFVVFRYLGTILFPDIRHMGLYLDDITTREANDPWAWIVLAAILALPLAALVVRRIAPALAFAILWYLAAQLLESTVIPLELAFEHRNYLALFGPMLAIGYYVARFLLDAPMKVARLGLAVPFLGLAAATLVRAHQWSTPDDFINHEAENHPFSPRAQNEMINIDVRAGNVDKVIAGVRKVQQLKPNGFWPLTLDLNVACTVSNHRVQWERMEEMVKNRPEDIMVTGMLLFDADQVTHAMCPQLDVDRFDALLATLGEIYVTNRMPDRAEKMLVLRAHIASFRKDETKALQMLTDAATDNPGGLQAIHELAYYALNLGKLDVSQHAIDELQARVTRYSPAEQYDVDELRGYLAQARNEKAAADTKSHGQN
ncbi:hypothetical protein ELE36_03880 [Pseudolysobacter antarcticus]|uniref:Tetratricopeptide repeat protein n=1 Tax=Pseudolysobacter antarcticus TaxID=2511995 RepID=A0A411HGL6_9GAMM|nr:hypothetical protein [Pseudolysobacter antarcticus]QBB69587.1 hypothetical protein ELE36_03880 [Pseudolysobacter antarcticus]